MPRRRLNFEANMTSVETNGRQLRAVASRLSSRENVSLKPIQKRATEMLVDKSRSTVLLSPHSSPLRQKQTVTGALHTVKFGAIVCREKEIAFLQEKIGSCLDDRHSGSLYISGAPGTGKTATVTQQVQAFADAKKCSFIFLNCMQMTSPRSVYARILEKLCESRAPVGGTEKLMCHLETCLETTSKQLPLVIILDEIDQLVSRCQEVLYTIFGWPDNLKNARIVLIGIANALDLTERLLPGLQARSLRPIHLAFPPYSKEQIVQIISSHLLSASGVDRANRAMDNMAVQFCARKVAASSGDVRTALAICRRAIELARLEVRANQQTRTGSSEIGPSTEPSASPTEAPHLTPLQCRLLASPAVRNSLKRRNLPNSKSQERMVSKENEKENINDNDGEQFVVPGVRHISQAIREAQSGGNINSLAMGAPKHSAGADGSGETAAGGDGLPLHHKLVLAASLLLRRLRGIREATVGQLHDVYSHICSTRGQLAGLEMGDFVSVCELLDSHGLLRLSVGGSRGVGRASIFSTPARAKRVSLRLDDKGVERSLDDNLLLSSILAIKSLP